MSDTSKEPASPRHRSDPTPLADLDSRRSGLDPTIGARLTRRVVALGAESTGTTTLAEQLAERLDAPSVPEFLRHYAEERAAEAGSIWDVTWTTDDFDTVAEGQDRLEAEIVTAWASNADRSSPTPMSPPLVVCDTDALATAIWHRRYVGSPAPRFLRRATERRVTLYLLTSPAGVDFEQDGLRDGEHIREEMTGWFREALHEQGAPWIEVTGSTSERLEQAIEAIGQITSEPVLKQGIERRQR